MQLCMQNHQVVGNDITHKGPPPAMRSAAQLQTVRLQHHNICTLPFLDSISAAALSLLSDLCGTSLTDTVH